jgi:hypothetical protein
MAVPERETGVTGSLSLPDAPTREHLVVPPDEDGEIERPVQAERDPHDDPEDPERRD